MFSCLGSERRKMWLQYLLIKTLQAYGHIWPVRNSQFTDSFNKLLMAWFQRMFSCPFFTEMTSDRLPPPFWSSPHWKTNDVLKIDENTAVLLYDLTRQKRGIFLPFRSLVNVLVAESRHSSPCQSSLSRLADTRKSHTAMLPPGTPAILHVIQFITKSDLIGWSYCSLALELLFLNKNY